MEINNAPNVNYVWAGLLVEELVRLGVRNFFIAPGSRSSPLTAMAAKHPGVHSVVHYDERGLAFFALGFVSAAKYPAALICSSGTAAANFLPAVVEASKKKLPLIVLTADRPPELQNTGALQTIDQVKIYGDYVRWYTTLPTPDRRIDPGFVLTTADYAVFRSRDPMGGPVHLNCMFREPLTPDPTGFNAKTYLSPVNRWLKGSRVFTRYSNGDSGTGTSHDKDVISILNNTGFGIIVVGKLSGQEELQAVLDLADKLKWPLFPDVVSGLRMGRRENLNSTPVIHYFDQLLLSETFCNAFPIDTVLHLGGRITSKRWYNYVEMMKPENYIMVLGHSLRNDPLHRVTIRVKSRVRDFAQSIFPEVKIKSNDEYLRIWIEASETVDGLVEDFIGWKAPVSEIGVARMTSRLLMKGHCLFLSNSMPVREVDMYGTPDGHPIEVGGNRGASGIDGVIASACGFALASERTTALLIGDLAFLHDLNSLALVKNLDQPLIIVVINNDGGGIFSFLPIAGCKAAADIFEPFFGTPHGLMFPGIAGTFGLEYAAPQTMEEFAGIFGDAVKEGKTMLIEVKTDRKDNIRQHRKLQKRIKIEIDKMVI